MKTSEYLKKHVQDKVNYNGIIEDLTKEFDEFVCAADNEKFNYDKFKDIVKCIRRKWDNISMKKSGFALSEKSWGYFYAKIICKKRDELFDIKIMEE